MGNCMSSGGGEDGDSKKKSQAIDRALEEDSKKLRRECKILLLGMSIPVLISPIPLTLAAQRLRREWQVDHRQADEDHPPERLQRRRIAHVQAHHLQERDRLRQGPHRRHATVRNHPRSARERPTLRIHHAIHRRPRSERSPRFKMCHRHHRHLERSVYTQGPRPLERILHDGLGFIVSLTNPAYLCASADLPQFLRRG